MTTEKNSAYLTFSTHARPIDSSFKAVNEYEISNTDYINFGFEHEGKGFRLFIDMPDHTEGPISYRFKEASVILAAFDDESDLGLTFVYQGTFKEFIQFLLGMKKKENS